MDKCLTHVFNETGIRCQIVGKILFSITSLLPLCFYFNQAPGVQERLLSYTSDVESLTSTDISTAKHKSGAKIKRKRPSPEYKTVTSDTQSDSSACEEMARLHKRSKEVKLTKCLMK